VEFPDQEIAAGGGGTVQCGMNLTSGQIFALTPESAVSADEFNACDSAIVQSQSLLLQRS
jgi:hypothetical protein